jgi:hypothetical protein
VNKVKVAIHDQDNFHNSEAARMLTCRDYEEHFSYVKKRNYAIACAAGLACMLKLRFFWKGTPVLPPFVLTGMALSFAATDIAIDTISPALPVHEYTFMAEYGLTQNKL